MTVVSIVCITYNHEACIGKAVQGFLDQNVDFPVQILIGDDCSTDGTSKILDEIRNENPGKIELYVRSKNIGSTANLLDLFTKVRGRYVAYCEGDDYWINSNKLQMQVDFLEKNQEFGLVWTDIDMLYGNNEIKKSIFYSKTLKSYSTHDEILVNRPFLGVPTWVFRHKYINNYIIKFSTKNYIDGTFFLLLEILRDSKIHFIDSVTAVRRVLLTSQSNSGGIKGKLRFIKSVHQMQLDYARDYRLGEDILANIKRTYLRDAIVSAYLCDDIDLINEAINFSKKNTVDIKIKFIICISKLFPKSKIVKNILLKMKK